jgi:hypothetical protein
MQEVIMNGTATNARDIRSTYWHGGGFEWTCPTADEILATDHAVVPSCMPTDSGIMACARSGNPKLFAAKMVRSMRDKADPKCAAGWALVSRVMRDTGVAMVEYDKTGRPTLVTLEEINGGVDVVYGYYR